MQVSANRARCIVRDGIYNCSGNLNVRLRHVANQAYLPDSEVGEPAGEDRRYLY